MGSSGLRIPQSAFRNWEVPQSAFGGLSALSIALSEYMSFGFPPPRLGFRNSQCAIDGFRNLQSEICDLKLSEAWSIPHLEGSRRFPSPFLGL
jgi:hypothetical protein